MRSYRKYSDFLTEELGPVKVQKIAVDGGFTCPNRDGRLGTGGCTFCQAEAFAPSYSRQLQSIEEQIIAGKAFFAHKHRGPVSYLIYFQSYSGTYATVERLRHLYTQALSAPDVVGLVIGTRPDCISPQILDLLEELKQQKFVMVEYGVESCFDKTLQRVGRGHTFQCAEQAIRLTAERGIPVGIHLILGLPGETRQEMLQQTDLLNALPIQVLKLHQLQIMQGTPMADEWQQYPEHFHLFTAHEYAQLVAEFITRLRPDIALDRFAAESPSSLLLAPRWGLKPQAIEDMVEQFIAMT